ncbi:hypothetical protein [Psychrobacter sp. UBA3480]|uniref:hypothetical protein n=1 Tax=Psychrobacter sp. UBA3480 TaxID=1947350 RepID=UPI0025E9C29E|nr:hypothetical protein [Psychrobacter sp. UBA3480]
MNTFSPVNLCRVDKLDEQLAAAAQDIIGQINCTLYTHVKTLFTKHRYHSLQNIEINRIKKLLNLKLYIDFKKDAKALYIDRYYIETLLSFIKINQINYSAGYSFFTEMSNSVYSHLFTHEEREWISDQKKCFEAGVAASAKQEFALEG